MDFEQTLAAVMGFVGGDVTVHVLTGDLPLTTDTGGAAIVRMYGVLERAEGKASRLYREQDDEEDASNLFFSVGDDGGGFFLNPDLFQGALALSDDLLTITMPGVVLHLARGRSPLNL